MRAFEGTPFSHAPFSHMSRHSALLREGTHLALLEAERRSAERELAEVDATQRLRHRRTDRRLDPLLAHLRAATA
jgi:hypothetical protein